MNKTILLISIILVIAFSVIALIVTVTNSNRSNTENNAKQEDVNPEKEEALKIGKALLEEHFPNMNWDEEPIDAEEINGIWKVYNVVNREPIPLESGKSLYLLGGELYVMFRKDTGEVVRFGVND